jgi:uncharacterized protein YqeY
MITDTINQKIADALKKKDEVLLSTLRLLSSAFNYEKIALQHELTQEEEIAVVGREAKKRQDAIEAIRGALGGKSSSSDEELKQKLKKEEKELLILKEFLPKEMSSDELSELIEKTIKEEGAESMCDMGKVIGVVLQKAKGHADGKKVSEIVRDYLIKQ